MKNSFINGIMRIFPTKELVKELIKREGVHEIHVHPHTKFKIDTMLIKVEDEGPAKIILIRE